ncbi:MAG TPA: hypothetical protein VIN08_25670 [Ohtaekwangia sp.]|uniref:hypothetical protein n=1 Tax=Ohtaekwangia sp. TaxID=2066019 RepID=UPI002F92DC60
MVFYLVIGFVALCAISYLIIAIIFYKAMKVNQADSSSQEQASVKPQASRIPPRMEQAAAIQAGVYYVLPVEENGITYDVIQVDTTEPPGETHAVQATTASGEIRWTTTIYSRSYIPHLETDVQQVFAVDLYIEQDYICVKLEHRPVIRIHKQSGIIQA